MKSLGQVLPAQLENLAWLLTGDLYTEELSKNKFLGKQNNHNLNLRERVDLVDLYENKYKY